MVQEENSLQRTLIMLHYVENDVYPSIPFSTFLLRMYGKNCIFHLKFEKKIYKIIEHMLSVKMSNVRLFYGLISTLSINTSG